MNNEFVSYEIALKLKELGFDEPCFTYYYELTSNLRTHLGVDINNAWTYSGNKKLGFTLAPLYQQVFRWFREKKLIDLIVSRYQSRDNGDTYYYYQITNNYGIEETRHFKEGFFTYEKAELAGLQKMIKIIENQKK
jgi:hypothetical protein